MNCRNCNATLTRVFCDLGTSPLSNGYVEEIDLDLPEPRYPLRPYHCDCCMLVQLPVFEPPEGIFSDYAFFSGQSATWNDHCSKLARDLLRPRSHQTRVLELASNDGTLLRHAMRWTPNVTGVEPARNIATHALLRGLPTLNRFFGQALAEELVADGYRADIVIANNVLAHVPDLDDFLGGVRTILARDGLLSVEVPRLESLIRENQFDTIYHEHFSYFSLPAICDALARRGLLATDVEWLPTHGGSMRVLAQREEDAGDRSRILERLQEGVVNTARIYDYAHRPPELKQRVRELVDHLRHAGKSIAGYGAPAKATTFLSYCGIDRDTIDFIVDSTPAKQGRYLPGARIPILAPEALVERRPDVVMILPWNWRDEILPKIERACDWAPLVICRDQVLNAEALAVGFAFPGQVAA